MSEVRAVPAGKRARGEVRVPGSKSASHRHLNLALVARKPLRIRNLLRAEDIDHFLRVLGDLGWGIRSGPGDEVRLLPQETLPASAELFAGKAGTLGRFLTASLTTLPGRWILDGAPRLRERPVGPLVETLRTLGAEIDCRGEEGFLPLEIRGGSLEGGVARLDAGSSSQYLSALMMAGLSARRPSRVEVVALTSSPYVEITASVVESWGGEIDWDGHRLEVRPGLDPPPEVTVEGDDSSAAYPAAAAVLTGGRVELLGLPREPQHGDRRFLEVLAVMGGEVEWRGDRLLVSGTGSLTAVDRDMGDLPDQVPTLAALAPWARGTTRIRGVPHLRIKESDRLAAMARELGRLGVPVEETKDGLSVEGVWAEKEPPSDPVAVVAHDDHRIAMSLAVAGLRRPGVRIEDSGVVAKSYPGFWDDLERLVG
ncbi:MAG: 3-phosphoshikimate 1-carboxyvinyltransferase [Thermoanaerobaculia bacterium]|nr:3-phosphoshikimate 1-carboxyvinyltransferase [Thermoanaerobaculia bacterium]